jgi:hypothetical protein
MNEERETTVRWRQAFTALGEGASPRPDCPEPDRLWAAAAAESPVEERHEIIAHTATCPSCAAAFRLARGLSQEPSRAVSGEGAVEPLVRPARRGWLRWGAPLAALAAALILAVWIPGGWRSGPQPYRGGPVGEISSRVPEGAALPRERADLQWTAGLPGSRYEVRVLTRDGREIAVESGLTAPSYRIPPAALAAVPAGTMLYWQVKALQPGGAGAGSKTFSILVR